MEGISNTKKKDNFKDNSYIKIKSVYVLLLLALVNWISHFLYFMRFGLYEDDYSNIAQYFGIGFPDLSRIISNALTRWEQGHPLAFLPSVFTYAGEMLGGFHFLYVLAFLIVTVNSFLMYKLLNKIFSESSIFAITGALAFCLFPSDTTKSYLQHDFVIQVAISFFLIATLFYLYNKKILAYLTIILVIFTYETPFMVFFGVPFLKIKWDKKFRKEYIIHCIILSTIIALMFIARKHTGDYRVSEVSGNISGVIAKAIAGLFIGPFFNIFLFARAPVVSIINLFSRNSIYWWYYNYVYFILAACFLFFMWLFYKLKPDFNSGIGSESSGGNSEIAEDNISTNNYFIKIIKLLIAAVILVCLSYSVSFTHFPPTAIVGRLTSVHMSAAIGSAVSFGCMCCAFFYISEKYNYRKTALIVLSVYFTLLMGYQLRVQKDFVDGWRMQKILWAKVISLCPDIKDGTRIFILNGENNKWIGWTNYIYPYAWSDILILNQMFKFPTEWKLPPQTLVVNNEFRQKVALINGKLKYPDPRTELGVWETLQDSNVILLHPDNKSQLVRMDSSYITIKGEKLYLKPKEEINNLAPLEKKPLYELLMKQ